MHKKDSVSDSEEEKINPFPTLETMKNKKQAKAFEKNGDDANSSDD